MSSNMWGSTDLLIVVGSLKPGGVTGILSESDLLPNPLALSAVSTVLHQKGRKRARREARLCVFSMTEYYTLETDALEGQQRTLLLELTNTNGLYQIESLGKPEHVRHSRFDFDIVWVEV